MEREGLCDARKEGRVAPDAAALQHGRTSLVPLLLHFVSMLLGAFSAFASRLKERTKIRVRWNVLEIMVEGWQRRTV